MRFFTRSQDGAACPGDGLTRSALSDLHHRSHKCCVLQRASIVQSDRGCTTLKCKGAMITVGSIMRVNHGGVLLLYVMLFSSRRIFYGTIWLHCLWINVVSDIQVNKLAGDVASIGSF